MKARNRVMRSLPCLLFLIMVTPLSSFNIDTRKKWITPPTAPLSWPKVLQHSDGDKTWVLATSSVEDNPSRQLGRLNKCDLTSNQLHCKEVGLRGNIQKSKIQDGGIAIARSAERILACLQKKRVLRITEELNGICTWLRAGFQEETSFDLGKIIKTKFNRDQNNNNNKIINITDADNFISADSALGISTSGNSTSNNSRSSRACKADSGTEIAIVLGGSGSIEPEDFERAKGFISNMMTSFWRKCPEVTFPVVQYGAEIRTEFDLQESSNQSSALSKVHNITQLCSVTKTSSALQHVLDEIFNESCGSVKDAHRMILVMTDGKIFLDPLSLTDVMSSLKMATIKRYALGVGDFFSKQRALKELQLIASDSDEDYLFKRPDCEALDGFLSVLERNVLGTSVAYLPEAGSGYENQNSNNNNIKSDVEEDDDDSSDSGTEIAIVLDGSGSIEPEDFERAKGFIYNMMKAFYEKCSECNFALVQYGNDIRTEFNFLDSLNANATLQKVQNITQLGKVTKTASAIQHVLDSIFSESQGSQKNAAKIMVVVTDGEIFQDSMDLTVVINSPNMAGIDRYAIGVGEAFNKSKALNELQLIASDPDESHLFRVTNYLALDGLLSTLQQKIIAIDGTAGDITEHELAQTGFSAQILDKQHILVGAVGAYDWSGGILLYDWVTSSAAFLNESKEAKEARYGYLGYSVAVANAQDGALYVAGAPRHSMTGKVLVFRKDHLEQILQGDQVGSYFGSELCSVDVNQDGETDYLLVGAPLYHIHGEEGRVYVYRLKNGNFSPVGHLSVQTPSPFARFGFSVASVGDISRDGYVDIAIGAPLEDRLSDSSTFGSIYIYNGDKNGIRSTFSQRIRAAEIAPGLQYFGQSIDGGFDFTDDDLIDITVGSFGNVTVLRSRPVVRFNVTMRFIPERIFDFHSNSIITAELCLNMISPLKASQQAIWHLSIHYTVDLDVRMKKKRAHFEDQKSTLRREKKANEPMCAELLFYILVGDFGA
ncbi:integrin alpha-E [Dermochelys coriacea]|uniref:integrin alpha-E n=1 Tax=Dermochelys coriacea TaxID=27794 RepID=UPI001CA96EEC|nr:integrin alpha-E [Dermochelys coriacea]